MAADRGMATAADAEVGNTFPSVIEKALSNYRERLFLFCTNKDTGRYLVSGHIFPVDADPDIYTY